MRKILISVLLGIGLTACGDNISEQSPTEFIKALTIKDTHEYCMKVNGNRAYCNCEVEDLARTFPWDTYMVAVDVLAGEPNHVAAVIARHNGSRKKVLEELNCKDCILERALTAIDVSPSPRCAELLE